MARSRKKPHPSFNFYLYGFEGGMHDVDDDGWVLYRGAPCPFGNGYYRTGFKYLNKGNGYAAGYCDEVGAGSGAGFVQNWNHELVGSIFS
jgi:hypothetical protein